jgi:hypothetical protein
MTIDEAQAAHEVRTAWWSTLIAAILVFAGQLAYALIDTPMFGLSSTMLTALRLGHALLAAVIIALLVAQASRPSAFKCTVAFVTITLPFYPIFWIAESEMLVVGVPWSPFIGHKLLVIGVALFAPVRNGVLLGTVLVALFGLEAIAQWTLLDFRHVELVLPGEPLATGVYTLLSLGFVVYRRRHLVIERAYAQTRAEAELLERIARVLLAVRDRTNTPLQSLEIATELLASRVSSEPALFSVMRRSLARLRELTRILAGSDRFVRWTDADSAIDADMVLRRLEATIRCEPEASKKK